MKKILPILLIVLVLVIAVCCVFVLSNPTSSNNDEPTFSTNNSYTPTKKEVSESEKKEIAEREVLKMALEYMKQDWSKKFDDYDISATRYKIGSITHSGKKYRVKGTLYLYDEYGNYADTALFNGTVDIEDDGSAHAYWPTINIQ